MKACCELVKLKPSSELTHRAGRMPCVSRISILQFKNHDSYMHAESSPYTENFAAQYGTTSAGSTQHTVASMHTQHSLYGDSRTQSCVVTQIYDLAACVRLAYRPRGNESKFFTWTIFNRRATRASVLWRGWRRWRCGRYAEELSRAPQGVHRLMIVL